MSQAHIRTANGDSIGSIGYGMLGLTVPWAPVDYADATKLLKLALNQGANLWNASSHYGTPEANSLHLLRHYFQQYPEDADRVFLTMKGAYHIETGPNGTPEGIRASVEEAYSLLQGVKIIDVFAMSRVDPNVSIETSVRALAELVKEGKIGGIGLSEVNGETIRRACAVHPVTTAEIELSLFTPDAIKNGVAEACRQNNVKIVAYSPIGRGWLTSDFRKLNELPDTDFRRMLPRFQPEAFEQNARLVEAVEKIAQRKGVTTAQVALSWVVAQGAVPIPGSKSLQRIEENCTSVVLSEVELEELQVVLDTLPVSGQRYGGAHEKLLNA